MGLFGSLFGSAPKSSSTSSNTAAPFITQTYSPMAQTGVGATNALSGLLGLGGDQEAAKEGYQNFLNSSGYQNVIDSAMRGITGSHGAQGLLRSGATLGRMQDRASDIGGQYFTNYLGQVSNLANQGLNAGQLITSAGQTSSSTQKGGSGGVLGAVASIGSLFSDRRLKRDIELLERTDDGLGIYAFNYLWDEPEERPHIGVMADEVSALRPWALGSEVEGFATVNYGAL